MNVAPRFDLPADPAALRVRIDVLTEAARASGALQPIATAVETVEDEAVPYALRIVDSLRRKPPAGSASAATSSSRANPFLPYDPTLYVAHLPQRHVLVLNKFPVIEPHALIVTEAFEAQSAPLSPANCAATAVVLGLLGGLVFYNAGAIAGGSQPHRHLQWVPATLDAERHGLPVSAAVLAALAEAAVGDVCVARLPFRHALTAVPVLDAESLHAAYRRLLSAIGRDPDAGRCEDYNGLIAPGWMMLVPRTQAALDGISINALGFAGTLLLRDAAQRERARRIGVAALLRAVTA